MGGTNVHAQQEQALQKIRLQLFWKHQFEFAGFYAAIEQGYYREAGIELEFVPYNSQYDHVQSVLDGAADIGLSGVGSLKKYHQGEPLILLGSYFKRSPLVLITQPELKSLKDLAGSYLHGQESQLRRGSIHELLALHNVDSQNVNLLPYSNPISAFAQKKVEAVIAFSTDLPWQLNERGLKYNIYDPNQFGIVTQDLNLFTTVDYSQKNTELLKKFINATRKGWHYALSKPEEVIDVIKRDYDEQDLPVSALIYEANATKKLIQSDLYGIGEILPNKLQLISQRLLVSGQIEKLLPIEAFLFDKGVKLSGFEELLTVDEKDFLDQINGLTVQSEADFPPFNYRSNEQAVGYSIDYIEKLERILNKDITFIRGKHWSEYLDMLKHKEIDLLVNIAKTAERQEFSEFTEPFIRIQNLVVTRTEDNYKEVSLADLKSGKVAIIRGYVNGERLKTLFGISNVLEVSNIGEALNSLLRKEADFFISNGAVASYHIENQFLTGLSLSALSKDFKYPDVDLRLATHKDDYLLLSILQKAMQQIPESELVALRRKWFNHLNGSQYNKFSLEESDYINTQSPVLCRLNISEGNDRSMELLALITEGIDMDIRAGQIYSWQAAIEAFEAGECDLLTNATATEERKKKWLFTEPYSVIQQSIITSKEIPLIVELGEWLDKTFVMVKGDIVAEKLLQRYPDIKLIFVEYPIDAAQAVSKGNAFGYIGSYNTHSNMLTNYVFGNLRLNNVLPSRFSDAQSIAVAKSNPILVQVINKALSATNKLKINELLMRSSVRSGIESLLTKKEIELTLNRELIFCNISQKVMWNDFVSLITANSPIRVRKTEPLSWSNAIKALENGECDFLPQITETEERKQYFSFTPSFHQESRVIATVIKHPFISNIQTYLDRRFVIEKGNILKEQLLKEYPTIDLVEVEFPINAIEMVKSGRAFAYLANISDVTSIMHEYAIENIQIAGVLPDRFDDYWSIATRKDDAVVNSLLTKILQLQDKQALQQVLSNHSIVNVQSDFNYDLVWKITVTAIFIVAIFIFWNRRLALLNQQLSLAKQETEEAQKLVVIQEKLSSLGTLTAGVAHEINNPVNFMHASVYMMEEEIERIKAFLRELAGGDSAEPEVIESFEKEFNKLSELAKTAMQGSNRVKTIVNDLRMFSRLEDEKQESAKLAALIQSTVHLVRTQYVDIEFEVDCPFDPLLTCYPAKLSQVFMNVIVNACQAIEARIEIEPELKGKIYVSMTEVDRHVIVSFEDNGSGMDEKTMQQIFDPFYTTKDVGKGTGLGMSISFGIIEEHQGKINISSKVNAGTVIEVHLPVL